MILIIFIFFVVSKGQHLNMNIVFRFLVNKKEMDKTNLKIIGEKNLNEKNKKDEEETQRLLKELMKDPDFRKDIIESEKNRTEQSQKKQEEESAKSLRWFWIGLSVSVLTLLNLITQVFMRG